MNRYNATRMSLPTVNDIQAEELFKRLEVERKERIDKRKYRQDLTSTSELDRSSIKFSHNLSIDQDSLSKTKEISVDSKEQTAEVIYSNKSNRFKFFLEFICCKCLNLEKSEKPIEDDEVERRKLETAKDRV